jgi:hypothetical protein
LILAATVPRGGDDIMHVEKAVLAKALAFVERLEQRAVDLKARRKHVSRPPHRGRRIE